MKKILFFQRRGSRSQTLVETALVLPLFIFLVIAFTDYGRYFFLRQTVLNAIREAGRVASTGRILSIVEATNRDIIFPVLTTNIAGVSQKYTADPNQTNRVISREQTVKEILRRNLYSLTDLRNDLLPTSTTSSYFTVESWPGPSPYSATANSPNVGPGERSDDNVIQYVRIKVLCPFSPVSPFFYFGRFSSANMVLTNKSVFVNEAWGSTYTNRY